MSTTSDIKEMVDLIGTTVNVKVEGFTVPMTISNVKVAYGNKRLLVTPVGGSGESWIDSSRVTELGDSPAFQSSPTDKPSDKPTVNVQTTEAGEIRAWARSRGIHVNERGRIPAPVVDQYRKENSAHSGCVAA